ncbi:N-acetylmuramoyl-L-alanine amidase [Alkalicoccus urumqiensis]|nr:N-acetylmuramoyl-L-alanine amidase [Alkalicoccus urumqiensis]
MLRKLIQLGVVAALLAVGFVLWTPNEAQAAERGVISGLDSGDTLNVRDRADLDQSTVIGKLSNGDVVHISRETGIFYEISFKRETAYVSKYYVDKQSGSRGDTSIVVNGEPIAFPVAPRNENNQLLVPYRAISEALGINITWNQQQKTVTAEGAGKTVLFEMTPRRSYVDGSEVSVNPRPNIVSGTTMVPLRFFAETFEADVDYVHSENRVFIESDGQSVTPGEDVLSDSDFDGNLTAVVNTNGLNVRDSGSTRGRSVGTLQRGDVVMVEGFSNEWAKVRYGSNQTGFVHTYYLQMKHFNNDLRILGNPQWQRTNNRDMLNLYKIGGTTVDVSERADGFTITTNATDIDAPSSSERAIKRVRVETSGSTKRIHVDVADGYHYVYRETFGSVFLTFLPPGLEGKRIVIDAGHGAKDPGARANGLVEKELALDISLEAERILEAAGADVIMTRTTDEFLELTQRADIANDEFADAFISVHLNAFNGTAKGSETFWHGASSGPNSEKLAHAIQDAMVAKLGTHYRRVAEQNFSVIRRSSMPSTLIEFAFLDNAEDAAIVKRPGFTRDAADAIKIGLEDFYHVR